MKESSQKINLPLGYFGAGVISAFISLLVAVMISIKVSSSCAYHAPLFREQGVLFKVFFDLEFFHPNPNGFYWLFSLIVGFLIGIGCNKLRYGKLN